MQDKISFHGEELTASQLEARLGQIDGLLSHPGWKLVRDLMERESRTLTRRICQPTFPDDQTAFSRGAIYAAEKFIDLPNSLAQDILGTLALSDNDPA